MKGAKPSAPVHFRGGWVEEKSAYSPLKKCLQAGEGGLSKLAEGNGLVGLELLQPRAETELIPSVRQRQAIFIGEEISGNAQVAAVVAAGEADGSLRVGSGAAADHHGADGAAENES